MSEWKKVVLILGLVLAVMLCFCAVIWADEESPTVERVFQHKEDDPIYLRASEPVQSATPGKGFIEARVRFDNNVQRQIQFWKVAGGKDRLWSTGHPVPPPGVRNYVLIVYANEFMDYAGNQNDEPAIAHFVYDVTPPNVSIEQITFKE